MSEIHMEERLQGIHSLLQELSSGQQKILSRLDRLSSTDIPCCNSNTYASPGVGAHMPSRLATGFSDQSSQYLAVPSVANNHHHLHVDPNGFLKSPRAGMPNGTRETVDINKQNLSIPVPPIATTVSIVSVPEPPKPKTIQKKTPKPIVTNIIYSDDRWRECLHALLVVLACLEFISVSSSFAQCPSSDPFLYFLFVTSSLALTAETVANFFTALPHKKWEITEDAKLCRKTYLRTWFGWDAAMAFPLDLFVLAGSQSGIGENLCLRSGPSAFGVLSLMRMLHIVRVPTYFRRRNPIMATPRWASALIFLAASTLALHSFAVIWMLSASKAEQGVLGESYAYQYASAFNWGFQTFVHGKSDVYAHSTTTLIISMVIKILGFIAITTMEAKLAEFFVNHDPFHVWARQRRQQLASLISGNHVNWEIQKSIMGIYPTLRKANMRQFYNVMQDLPPFLSAKITECMKIQLIKKVPLFADATEECHASLANVLVEEVIPPETDIVCKGDAATSMFFLVHGVVDVIVPNEDGGETVLTALKDGSWFGEIALLQDTTRTATVRTATVVTVYRLDKADFTVIAKEYPEMRDKLEAVALQRLSSLRRPNSVVHFTSLASLQPVASAILPSPRFRRQPQPLNLVTTDPPHVENPLESPSRIHRSASFDGKHQNNSPLDSPASPVLCSVNSLLIKEKPPHLPPASPKSGMGQSCAELLEGFSFPQIPHIITTTTVVTDDRSAESPRNSDNHLVSSRHPPFHPNV